MSEKVYSGQEIIDIQNTLVAFFNSSNGTESRFPEGRSLEGEDNYDALELNFGLLKGAIGIMLTRAIKLTGEDELPDFSQGAVLLQDVCCNIEGNPLYYQIKGKSQSEPAAGGMELTN
ncbi:MAG: hypothetical protein OEY94_00370 [Alphaproteobacteria bacterium]|nr:hypothetical protein [Alphaproteobacteria bacterium]